MLVSFIRPFPTTLHPGRLRALGGTSFLRPTPWHCPPALIFKRFLCAQYTTARMVPPPVRLSDTVEVLIVPIIDDNYSYIIHDKAAKTAALVDPAQPHDVLTVAEDLGVTVTTSLTTHHHWDHAGGNEELASLLPGIDIVGSAYETAPAVTVRLFTGDEHTIRGTNLKVRALRTPCHTNGHLCFTLSAEKKAVFTGDTLFVAGCGKFFEGSADDMHRSLNGVLAALDDDTLVFCGHEYTVTNLKFAASVEPGNADIASKLEWAKERVAAGLPTVPSSIGDEKKFNPFMRNKEHVVKKAMNLLDADGVAVMKALRESKNNFRPS